MEGAKHLSADGKQKRHSPLQNIAPRAATRWRRAAAGGARPARPRPSPLLWQRSRAARSWPGTVAMRAANGPQPAGEAEETGSDGRGEAARGGQPCERGGPRLASLPLVRLRVPSPALWAPRGWAPASSSGVLPRHGSPESFGGWRWGRKASHPSPGRLRGGLMQGCTAVRCLFLGVTCCEASPSARTSRGLPSCPPGSTLLQLGLLMEGPHCPFSQVPGSLPWISAPSESCSAPL